MDLVLYGYGSVNGYGFGAVWIWLIVNGYGFGAVWIWLIVN